MLSTLTEGCSSKATCFCDLPATVTVIAGGATRSDLWLQIHADVSNVPLTVTRVTDAPALGSAILAAVAAGAFDSIEEAAGAMVTIARRIEPSAAAHQAYRAPYEAYKALYPALSARP